MTVFVCVICGAYSSVAKKSAPGRYWSPEVVIRSVALVALLPRTFVVWKTSASKPKLLMLEGLRVFGSIEPLK